MAGLPRWVLIGVLLAGCAALPARPTAGSAIAPATTSPPIPAISPAGATQATPTTAAPPSETPLSTSPPTTSPRAVRRTTQPLTAIGLGLPRASPGRLVLIGDSIVDQLCSQFPEAECYAFPGAWVADVHGVNLVDGFVSEAHLGPADTVVLSSIGGWHSSGVDDGEILARLQALYQRLTATVRRLVVLVPPYPNFLLCTNPTTPEAVALLGDRHDELCHTQQLIADLERSWVVTDIPIVGPYVADEEHETPTARADLARAIHFVLSSDPADVNG